MKNQMVREREKERARREEDRRKEDEHNRIIRAAGGFPPIVNPSKSLWGKLLTATRAFPSASTAKSPKGSVPMTTPSADSSSKGKDLWRRIINTKLESPRPTTGTSVVQFWSDSGVATEHRSLTHKDSQGDKNNDNHALMHRSGHGGKSATRQSSVNQDTSGSKAGTKQVLVQKGSQSTSTLARSSAGNTDSATLTNSSVSVAAKLAGFRTIVEQVRAKNIQQGTGFYRIAESILANRGRRGTTLPSLKLMSGDLGDGEASMAAARKKLRRRKKKYKQ